MVKNIIRSFLLFSLMLTFSLGTTVNAKSLDTKSTNIKELSGKYNLKDIEKSSIPSNITPMEFKNVEEADKFLSKVKSESAARNLKVKEQKSKLSLSSETVQLNMFTTLSTSSSSQAKRVSYDGLGSTWLKVYYTYSGSIFYSCSQVTAYCSGVTMGYDYVVNHSESSIIDGGRTLAASVDGITSYYLLIDGIVKIAQESDSYYAEFYL